MQTKQWPIPVEAETNLSLEHDQIEESWVTQWLFCFQHIVLGCLVVWDRWLNFSSMPNSASASTYYVCFPGSSANKEFACNAGDMGSIHGLGRSPGEEIGYTPQDSWASLVAQTAKNLPTMRDSNLGFNPWVGKIPWKRAWQPTPGFLPGESPVDRGAWWATVHVDTKSWTWSND